MYNCLQSIDPMTNDQCTIVIDQLLLVDRTIDAQLHENFVGFYHLCMIGAVIFKDLR